MAENGSNGVDHAYKTKTAKYRERCESEGMSFLAMAVDTFGSWHSVALMNLKKLGRQLARAVDREEAEVVRHFRQRLGVLLVKDNMAMLLARVPNISPPYVDGIIDSDN